MLQIGKHIRAARLEKGLSQKELANAAGISENALWEHETNRSDPRLETAVLLADALGITLDELIGRKL